VTRPAVKLDNVSMRFLIRHQKARSFQDALVNFVHRNNGSTEEFWALKDVSFEVRHGETLGIIGENGSGKSTILKLITRILEPTSGKVTVNGKVSALIELGAGFHPDLSGRENMYLNGSILGFGRKEMDHKLDEIVAFAELERFIDTPVKHYSSGMYARLGFSVAISVDPDILIIDEVLSVGDESFQLKCVDRISDFRRRGKTILLVSHDLDTMGRLCDRVAWLRLGRVEEDSEAVHTIQHYQAEMRRRDGLTRESEHEPAELQGGSAGEPGRNRYTRGVEIGEVRLLSASREERSTFRTGESIVVWMRYRIEDSTSDHTFGVELRRTDGLVINRSCHARRGPLHVGRDGWVVEEIEFDRVPLLPGSYDLLPFVRVSDQEDALPRSGPEPCQFSMWNDDDQVGVVVLPHRWIDRKGEDDVGVRPPAIAVS
jgi:ABC-type polysaccharide/polyol phosphate transport system ATPase subunit